MRKDKTHKSLAGEARWMDNLTQSTYIFSPLMVRMHRTTTVRRVASELLQKANWYNKETLCEGIGISLGIGL